MAREEKRFELKPVEELGDLDDPVVRLESGASLPGGRDGRGDSQSADAMIPSRRLVLPTRSEFEARSHQPGIEALIEAPLPEVHPLEGGWGTAPAEEKHLPWGWFALIGVILVGGVGWSLSRVKQADTQALEIRETTRSVLSTEAEEQREAADLIDRLEAAKAAFFAASSIEELASAVRHPERVRPLLEHYYAQHPLTPQQIVRTRNLTPQTIGKRGNFWTSSVELDDRSTRALVLEVLDSGEAKVDWETFVCYQPMDWTAFAQERPAGKSYDFRVNVEADNLFSHEFADPQQWSCFRLTASDSIETLFGYVRHGNPIERELAEMLQRNKGRKVSMILRITIPEGLQSHRGVVIEKLLSPRWLYLDPPDSGS
jgi:hypothetical protein